jgi:hypothetical protein
MSLPPAKRRRANVSALRTNVMRAAGLLGREEVVIGRLRFVRDASRREARSKRNSQRSVKNSGSWGSRPTSNGRGKQLYRDQGCITLRAAHHVLGRCCYKSAAANSSLRITRSAVIRTSCSSTNACAPMTARHFPRPAGKHERGLRRLRCSLRD